jgi:hypothetical protein
MEDGRWKLEVGHGAPNSQPPTPNSQPHVPESQGIHQLEVKPQCRMLETDMKTNRDIQRFKAARRKELVKSQGADKAQIKNFTLAAANTIRHQTLDVSRVELLEHEISPDN